jgi:hypothetical protein
MKETVKDYLGIVLVLSPLIIGFIIQGIQGGQF